MVLMLPKGSQNLRHLWCTLWAQLSLTQLDGWASKGPTLLENMDLPSKPRVLRAMEQKDKKQPNLRKPLEKTEENFEEAKKT